MFSNRYLIFGGTGSLGRTLVRRISTDPGTKFGNALVAVFSRDEAKHHKLSLEVEDVWSIIGDVRNYDAVLKAIRDVKPNIIINAAAMKQVPICEDNPWEAVQTNIFGTQNIVRAVEELYPNVSAIFPKVKVLSISTDKACKPVNSYGMTKALQERLHLNGLADAVFSCVRYGNVLESTGSVIPVFKRLIAEGKDLPITDFNMTRFLLSLDQAVDLIFLALGENRGGRIFIPHVKSAKIHDLAVAMIKASGKNLGCISTGIRPGEKIHEILISEEEKQRTAILASHYEIWNFKSIMPVLPTFGGEYSSADHIMTPEELIRFLEDHKAL